MSDNWKTVKVFDTEGRFLREFPVNSKRWRGKEKKAGRKKKAKKKKVDK